MTEPWGQLARQGAQALLEGRFRECERLAGEAARMGTDQPGAGLLAVIALREQGRAAEAEILARGVLADHPGIDEGHAVLGAVLADLGRDGEARRQLDRLGECDLPLAAQVLAAEIAAALESQAHAEVLHARLTPHADVFAGCHGSVARHLGLLCHVLGRWEEAESHFRVALHVNQGAGAPVLVAHTSRHYSALLRARGEDGDWERAIDLLAEAATIYRRLEIERLADEAEMILRRSQDLATADDVGSAVNVFRRTASGWDLAYGGQRAVMQDLPGLGHIAALLVAEGRPLHAVDLVESTLLGDSVADSALGDGVVGAALGDGVVGEYRSRLADVEAQALSADPVTAALARAERDFLDAELAVLAAGKPAAGEVGDRARRLVALRVRTSLDRIEENLPALARHLRRSIRTGTFCLYDPERPERWRV